MHDYEGQPLVQMACNEEVERCADPVVQRISPDRFIRRRTITKQGYLQIVSYGGVRSQNVKTYTFSSYAWPWTANACTNGVQRWSWIFSECSSEKLMLKFFHTAVCDAKKIDIASLCTAWLSRLRRQSNGVQWWSWMLCGARCAKDVSEKFDTTLVF